MALSELVAAIGQQVINQRKEENELLADIAALTDYETAEAAKELYKPEIHAYSFEGYLYQLNKLRTVLGAGVPPEAALEAVDSCADEETIIKFYRGGTA